jgi:hypothetical protein
MIALYPNPELAQVAREVEQTLERIMADAAR